ncbi:MAG: DUF3783 domain-containing protein [Selenomonadaceae bacterium]
MKKAEEKVLLYHFIDEDKLQKIKQTLGGLKIPNRDLSDNMYKQKVGYLVGMAGFNEIKNEDEDDFVFPHEVMIFYNVKRKRLDTILKAFKEDEISPIKFKAMVTPFNRFWTLRRLCETMQKEHAAMLDKDEK